MLAQQRHPWPLLRIASAVPEFQVNEGRRDGLSTICPVRCSDTSLIATMPAQTSPDLISANRECALEIF